MSPAMIDAFIAATIGIVVLVAGFFASQWATGLKSSVDILSATIAKLNETFSGIQTKQAVHEEKLGQHHDDIKELFGMACTNPECQFRRRGDR